MALQRRRGVRAEPTEPGRGLGGLGEASEKGTDVGVGVPPRRLLLQDEIGAHAAAREVLDALDALGAVGVGVEVARAGVADVLEELHQPERRLGVRGPEPEVLVVAADDLVVQVDVEELARLPRLGHRVGHVQAGHVLVGDLGIHAHQLRVVEGRDEPEIGAGGREVDVAARLVRLRLEGEAVVVAVGDRVLAQEVQRLAEPPDGDVGAPAAVRLGPLAPAPHDEDPGAQLGPEVHRPHRLLHREGPNRGVVGGERAVLEGGVGEQVRGDHGHDEAVVAARLPELAHDAVALGRGRVDGHEVVVVEVHAPGADLAEQRYELDRGQPRPDRLAERVAAGVADRPQAERELVLRTRSVGIVRHGSIPPPSPARRHPHAPACGCSAPYRVWKRRYCRSSVSIAPGSGTTVPATRTAAAHASSTEPQTPAPTPASSAAP